MSRWLGVGLPFLLIAAGAAALYASPWPAILHLMLGGAAVRVAIGWQTVGLPALAALCWAAAIALSLRIKRPA